MSSTPPVIFWGLSFQELEKSLAFKKQIRAIAHPPPSFFFFSSSIFLPKLPAVLDQKNIFFFLNYSCVLH